jgi:hypothetical protein
MKDNEFQEFSMLWKSVHLNSAGSKEPTDDAINLAFELLSEFNIEDIKLALMQHGRAEKFAPTPSCIVKIIQPETIGLSADEAWAMCPSDEDQTIRWSQFTAEAYAIASGVQSDDFVAKRMAFKSAYDRIVGTNKQRGISDNWVISFGNDSMNRVYALEEFVQLGYVTEEYARQKVPNARFTFDSKSTLIGSDRKNIDALQRIAEVLVDADIAIQPKSGHILDDMDSKSRAERIAINAKYEAEFEKKRKIAIRSIKQSMSNS